MDLKKELDRHRDISLSDEDVLKLVENKAKVVSYRDLKDYESLDELLAPYGAIFLLYEAQPNYGHWCALFKRDDKTVEFFDPYGGFIDTQLEYIPDHFRKISNQDYPHLTALLYHSPYDLTYSEKKFQKYGDDIKTCGRWTALRIVFRDFPLKEFARLFQGTNSDYLATFLTLFDLNY